MRFLLEPPEPGALDDLAEAGRSALSAGLDGVLLRTSRTLPAPLVAAAALAGRVPSIRIAAHVEVGESHPLEVAEEAAVVDVASGGRLILLAEPAPGREGRYAEALDLVRTALAPRPFRFEGATWRVPANLPENVYAVERWARLTPAPIQPRLEIWGAGGGRDEALARGLGYLADVDDDPTGLRRAWDRASAALGPAAIGAARGRRERYDGDPAALVARLRRGREAFHQSWAAVQAPADAAMAIGRRVRPRVQLDRLPDGLEAHWDATLPSAPDPA